MDDSDSRVTVIGKDLSESLELFESTDPDVQRIIACLQRTNRLTDYVIECLDKCSESTRKEILYCLLLNEFETIENELTNIQNELVNIQSRTLSCATDSVQVCGLGIDGVIRAVQQDTFGTVSTLPNASTYCQAGQLFSYVARFSNFINIAFKNPVGNTKTMYLENILGGISIIDPADTARKYVDTITVLIEEITSPNFDIQVTPVNCNLGSLNTSTIIVSKNFEPTTIKTLSETRHPTGEVFLNFLGQIIVPPGHNLLIQVHANLVPGFKDEMSTTVTWFEL